MSYARIFKVLALCASLVAFVVITLGAYVRLSNAGLGCPDWPGCYGKIVAPVKPHEVEQANRAYPHRPVETGKAWKEMVHRYFASFLGLLIVSLAVLAWLNRKDSAQALSLPFFLVLLVMVQGMLGMWTVTLLLKPVIVTLHLLLGVSTLALLWLTTLNARLFPGFVLNKDEAAPPALKTAALLVLFIVFGQIFLGGWTSTHYAALHCWDFPTCQGQWLPKVDFSEAFSIEHIQHEPGKNYEGGTLSNAGGVAVHLAHRIGALVTLLTVGLLSLAMLLTAQSKNVKIIASVMLFLLLAQVSLGISNVLLGLPLPIAVAHNGVAALLLLSLVTANYLLLLTRQNNTNERNI